MKRFISIILTLSLAFVFTSTVNIVSEAAVVSRDDGTWLFPLPSYYYNHFSDWAGCPGNGKCVFCGVYHSGWGDSAHTNQGGHNGFDIGAAKGTSVYASAAGNAYKFYNSARGNTVVIEHKIGNGYSYYTYYQHLSSFNISNGQAVNAGTVIGKVGSTGASGGNHLHFGMVLGTSGSAVNSNLLNSLEGCGWITSGGYRKGRILNNPASTNEAGFPRGEGAVVAPLKAHMGSVHYTFNPNNARKVNNSHSCNKGTYLYFGKDHPHYNAYKCSICGKEWVDKGSSNYFESCETCNPTPEAPNISVNVDGKHITVSWNSCKNANHYLVKILNSSGKEVSSQNVFSNSCQYTLEKDVYSVSVSSVSARNKTNSNDKSKDTFKVYDLSVLEDIKPAKKTSVGDKTYLRYDVETDWNTAMQWCNSHGGNLIAVTSEDKQKTVNELIKDTDTECWLGASNYNNNGKWKWTTDEELTYKNWGSNNTDNGKNYLSTSLSKNGQWSAEKSYFTDKKTSFIFECKKTIYEASQYNMSLRLDSYGDGVSLDKYLGSDTEVILPDKIAYGNEYDVIYLGDTFNGQKNIKKITIPASVKKITGNEFVNGTSIEELIIPDNVVEMCPLNLNKCESLKRIVIGDGYSGDVTISSDSVEKIILGKNVKSFNFSNCKNLKEVIINSDIKEISQNAFGGCRSLVNVIISSSVEKIDKYAFSDCESLESIILPQSVKSLGDYAFSNCPKLNHISLPSGLETIGGNVFAGCNSITSITIPDSVTKIDMQAFNNCKNIDYLFIGDGITDTEFLRFLSMDKLKYIKFGKGIKKIPINTISHCESLTDVVFSEGLEEIGWSNFYYCDNLQEVTFPNSLKKIDGNTFANCSNLKKVHISSGLETLGDTAFSWCEKLEEISVDEKNMYFVSEDGVLFDKSKKKIYRYPNAKKGEDYTIPNGVTEIADSAFCRASELTNIYTPDSVKQIGKSAFSYCSNLIRVSLVEGIGYIGESVFAGCNNIDYMYVPKTVNQIGAEAFSGCAIKSIDLPDSIKTIEGYQFANCKNLESITIPDSVESIGYFSFSNCKNLKDVLISNSVKEIVGHAFESCTSLESIIIPQSVKKIGDWALGYYSDLNTGKMVKMQDFKIYCYKDSAGEKYALDNGFDYELLKSSMVGDADGDGDVTSSDVLMVNQYLASIKVNCDLKNADVDGDGDITSSDVLILNQHLAGIKVAPWS